MFFCSCLLSPGGPGGGPDWHPPQEIGGFRPIPARIRVPKMFLIFILALSAAGLALALHAGRPQEEKDTSCEQVSNYPALRNSASGP